MVRLIYLVCVGIGVENPNVSQPSSLKFESGLILKESPPHTRFLLSEEIEKTCET